MRSSVRDIHWKDADARNEDLDLIIEESNRMSEMVNDILDYSQLQSGYIRLHPEFFDLADSRNPRLLTAPQPPKPTGSGSILSQILSLYSSRQIR